MESEKTFFNRVTASPSKEASAINHVSKAIERFEWKDNKTNTVKIDGNKLKEFYDDYVQLRKKLAKIESILNE
ncbi:MULTISPECIES: hypothetical protein [Vibrio harveyi group]|uniref:hypothetical protein n=1 Tax=Vibrio harveyi group TaxID=717610 RepID=UPI001110615F|nr:hypothetical protein [Vibrio rotiferianus]ELA9340981.1 hypothetical protein [Vibrio parahaemolyticus]NOH69684.1 hypothetical protein [Vibrio rotiferianus]TMX60968.1 hypothetical protein DA097_17125 [Vibrio rotiferianus]